MLFLQIIDVKSEIRLWSTPWKWCEMIHYIISFLLPLHVLFAPFSSGPGPEEAYLCRLHQQVTLPAGFVTSEELMGRGVRRAKLGIDSFSVLPPCLVTAGCLHLLLGHSSLQVALSICIVCSCLFACSLTFSLPVTSPLPLEAQR